MQSMGLRALEQGPHMGWMPSHRWGKGVNDGEASGRRAGDGARLCDPYSGEKDERRVGKRRRWNGDLPAGRTGLAGRHGGRGGVWEGESGSVEVRSKRRGKGREGREDRG